MKRKKKVSPIEASRSLDLTPTQRWRQGIQLQLLQDSAEAARRALVTRRAVVPSGEFITALNISRQALSKATQDNRYFALTVGNECFYPRFYLDDKLDRRKLECVSKALGTLPGWEKWRFFVTRKGSLGRRTPLAALRRGMCREVLIAATGYAEK